MTGPILELQGVSFWYRRDHKVLRDISLSVRRGSRLAVLGPNGAGKSTLLLHLNGTLLAREGQVLVNGEPITGQARRLREVRQQVALVFQSPDDQILAPIVEHDVAYGPQNLGLTEAETKRRVEQAMARLGITALRNAPTHMLSFGQKKRVALAGAVAMQPDVLVLDEPTAGLDPGGVRALLEVLEDLHRTGTTILLSTHDVDFAYAWADEVVMLHRGRLTVHDEPDRAFLIAGRSPDYALALPWGFEIRSILGAHRLSAAGRDRETVMSSLRRIVTER
ncbi:energy-coupling factor ABC transporter ATP-binding protein [Symbiobacterium terraclitae]|uniref:energy-coupling factor ABC transporter ATP-binding protein n=1 Tax=Symbiobacterium terraclitae TaxID=557451 RepID=UPI0035B5169C